ncbi:MAG: DivIVA domain-containing protein [Actinomycetota bacterium]|nr:DivIVA domain-containing protein [Actinomycetota bacterium]
MTPGLTGLTWLTANDIRTKAFTTRRSSYPAEEVRAFLDHVATLMDARSERINQLEDQLSIAESDERARVVLQRALGGAQAEIAALKDRVALAETVREDAVRRLKQVLDKAQHPHVCSGQPRADHAESGAADEDSNEIISQALAAAARTRADAHEQAGHIIEQAARSAENVRQEQQRWADEAERRLRLRFEELEAETEVQLVDARESATRILTAAADEAARIVGHASSEADRLVSEARALSSAWSATSSERRSELVDRAAPSGQSGNPPVEVNAEALLAKAAQLVSAAALLSPVADNDLFSALLERGFQGGRRGTRATRAHKVGDGDATHGT